MSYPWITLRGKSSGLSVLRLLLSHVSYHYFKYTGYTATNVINLSGSVTRVKKNSCELLETMLFNM